jgi:hypothetical protein
MHQRLSFIVLASLVGCAASSESAPTTVAAAAPATATAASDVPLKQVCERQTIIGSYRTQTICYTPGGPNDPNVEAVAGDLSRQIGANQAMGARAGKN